MRILEWQPEETAKAQLSTWSTVAAEPGVLHLRFNASVGGPPLEWSVLERWIRCRAVTVAEITADLSGPALDVALCSDLVYLNSGAELMMDEGEPTAGLLWAFGRAGRASLARCLLNCEPVGPSEAVRLGLAQGVLQNGERPPISPNVSLVALTTARDLMRSSVNSRSALELAAFKLLFAAGDPGEGARAFFERRTPEFDD